MGRRYSRYSKSRHRYSSHYNYDAGHEAARRHIEEAEKLSADLGGMDKEVKQFFFNLSHSDLALVLDWYGQKYGSEKQEYAAVTFAKWKAGSTHMSGLVAGRLFELLPPLMPMDLKLRIVEGLWEKQGRTGSDYILVPKDMSSMSIVSFVTERFFGYVGTQSIPSELRRRFDWLSGEDARVAEQLFRHAQTIQLKLKQRIASTIMDTVDTVANANSDVIHATSTTVTIAKHSVSIRRSEWVTEPIVCDQHVFSRGGKPEPIGSGFDPSWLWWIGIGAIVLFFLMK